MPFIIKTQCKEAGSKLNEKPITEEGAWVWVCEEDGGWVEATATSTFLYKNLPKDVKTFPTSDAAEKFIKRWKGHPWYYVPNDVYQIIEVKPKYKTIPDGWEVI